MHECLIKFKPDLIVLQETKKEIMQDRLVRSAIGPFLSEWFALPTIGTSGGILLARNPKAIKKIDVWMGSFSISLKLEYSSLGVEWLFTSIYDPPVAKSRESLWVELGTFVMHGRGLGLLEAILMSSFLCMKNPLGCDE